MLLLRKAVRSVWRGRRSYAACVALLAIGVAVFISFNLLFVNLTAAQQSHYRELRFADAFAVVQGIPNEAVARLADIDGVAAVRATLTYEARMPRDDDTLRPVTLRLTSYEPRDGARLNDFELTEGALPGRDGILVGSGFAAAHSLAPGDALPLVIGGREITPQVDGFVRAPEYVYAIPDTGTLFPDAEIFGFGYMERSRLETLAGRTGLSNRVAFAFAEGVSLADLRPQLEESLRPYGLRSLTDRDGQASHAMLQQEVDSIGAMATSLPSVFILMAAVILTIMLGRVIEQERMQIGTLKAFGFANRAIVGHYLLYGCFAGGAGGLIGVGLGVAMTDGISAVYLEYFNMPALRVPPDPRYLAGGFVLALASGVLGALGGARRVLKLEPAEAMRPLAPPPVRGDILARLPFLRALLASHGMMAIRNLGRNRFRSAFVLLGLSFSFALTALLVSFGEIFDALLFDQFTKIELYDAKMTLASPVSYPAALEAARALPGVTNAEAILELPCELSRAHLRETVTLTALPRDSDLFHLYDAERRVAVPLPSGGAVLSASLAEKLHARQGDILRLKTPYTGDDTYPLPVADIVASNLGAGAYLCADTLWALLDQAPAAGALLLEIPAAGIPKLRAALADARNITALAAQADTRQSYDVMLDSFIGLIYFMSLAGVGVAYAIIRSTAAISLSERSREYATMRVLGMHPREIARVVGFEYWVLLAVAIPPGIALTRGLKAAMADMINNDLFTIPLYTAPASFAAAAALCVLTVALCNRSAVKRVSGFDMVEVLKERE